MKVKMHLKGPEQMNDKLKTVKTSALKGEVAQPLQKNHPYMPMCNQDTMICRHWPVSIACNQTNRAHREQGELHRDKPNHNLVKLKTKPQHMPQKGTNSHKLMQTTHLNGVGSYIETNVA